MSSLTSNGVAPTRPEGAWKLVLSESTEMIERLQRRHLVLTDLDVLGNCNRLTSLSTPNPWLSSIPRFWIEYCGSSQLFSWGFSSTIRAPSDLGRK